MPRIPSMTPEEKRAFARGFPVHVGVDTGKTFHMMVAAGPDGMRRKGVRVDVGREGFDKADRELTAAFPDVPRDRMLVGLEFAGHNGFTFAYFLASRGYQVVSVLPFVTKRMTDVEDNSPRKDDAKDAGQVCALVGQGLFVTFPLLDDTGAELRLLATERRRLAVEATRLKNRLHSALDLAWPEFVGMWAAIDLGTPVALLEQWPVPEDLAQAPRRTVRALVKRTSLNHISPERVTALLESAETTIAVREGTDARRAEITRLMRRWAVVRGHIAEVEERLAVLVDRTPAARALMSVPGVSVVSAASLVAELGDPGWYEAPRQVLKLAGMNLAGKEKRHERARARPADEARAPAAPPAALPARRPVVPEAGALPRLLRGAPRPREAADERGVRRRAEARPDAPARDADRRAVRPRPLAGESDGRVAGAQSHEVFTKRS